MTQPAWVSEGSIRKYNRAVAQLVAEKKDVTEANVKELYVKWGGLVLDVEEDAEVIAEETDDAPKKRAKKAE